VAIDRKRPAAHLAALALVLAASAALPAAAFAQSGGASLHAGTLEVPLNKSQVVSADRPIAKAMVGNDEIADILPITDRSIYVLGKKMGTTSLTMYDSAGRVISVVDIAVGPDVLALGDQLRLLVPGENIEARITNDSVVLTGLASSVGSIDRAVQLAKAYAGDKVVNLISMGASQQVMLEVRFAEVSRSNNKDIGVRNSVTSAGGSFGGVTGAGSQFTAGRSSTSTVTTNNSSNTAGSGNSNSNTSTTTNSSNGGTSSSLNGVTGTITGTQADFNNIGTLAGQAFTGSGSAGSSASTSSGTVGQAISNATNDIGSATIGAVATSTTALSSILQLGSLADGFGIFRQNFRLGNLSIQSVLNAMESKGLAKTLAKPTLVALSGERASFLAGGEFPIPVAQSGGGGNGNSNITVEFKKFGVSLAFTPTVLGDKTINLVVEPEVSSIDPTASYSVGNITIPGLKTRRVHTTLELRDGESFVIAGLLSKDFQTSVRQIPLLGSIPILGALFRSSSFQKGETELMIVVTPRLVAPIEPGQVRLPTDRVKDPSELETMLLGEAYHPQPLEPVAAPPPARETSAADQPAPASPQASAELPAVKDDGYAY
jgi:pilus assembly protein CpaC